MFGPVSFANVQSVDVEAPLGPTFGEFKQLNDETWTVPVTLPTQTVQGAPITKLTQLAIVTAPTLDRGSSMETLLAIPDIFKVVIDLDPTANPPGSTVDVQFSVTKLGDAQDVAGACSDGI